MNLEPLDTEVLAAYRELTIDRPPLQREVCERTGLSKTMVREAIDRLLMAGLMRYRPGCTKWKRRAFEPVPANEPERDAPFDVAVCRAHCPHRMNLAIGRWLEKALVEIERLQAITPPKT